MIGVAFEAARFGMVGAGRMTGLACFNSWQQQVSGIRAAQGFFVTTYAGKASVGFVVEFCVRHPAGGDAGFGDMWRNVFAYGGGLMYVRQFVVSIEGKLVALLASLPPKKLLGVRGSNRNPLCGG